jgi:hypothetical protein
MDNVNGYPLVRLQLMLNEEKRKKLTVYHGRQIKQLKQKLIFDCFKNNNIKKTLILSVPSFLI